MNILITGALGATGKMLSKYLGTENSNNLIWFSDIKNIKQDNYHQVDLSDEKSVENLLAISKPDQIYHLAGTFTNNFLIDFYANVITTKNIFEGLLKQNLKTRLLLIGSSAEYGQVEESENPITEAHNLNPTSIYGLTKVYQTQLMQYYKTLLNIDVVMARTFNLIGEGLSDRLFIGRLYSQINQYKKGEVQNIVLGYLENKRDYISIEAAVQCYIKIMNKGNSGEIYNVGSGKSETLFIVLQKILAENGLSMNCVISDKKMGPNKMDIKDIFADLGKIQGL